ncbi:hypothetical protein Vadar_034001 [Vaccinium darrowii]|uniref:Uncharacterized protein n=1 Tax=Vaccinium darrowii TaxID=229202 RepID=A0ACB7Z0B0_9ERIC|nr:hypothetical protein Vadar_034001 [Vaccinium darrowii]
MRGSRCPHGLSHAEKPDPLFDTVVLSLCRLLLNLLVSATSSAVFFPRQSSPTRVNIYNNSSPSSPSVRASLDRPISPSRSISALKTESGRRMSYRRQRGVIGRSRRVCVCRRRIRDRSGVACTRMLMPPQPPP